MELFIKFNENAKLKIGDVVGTTTAEFPYDNYYWAFCSEEDLTQYAEVDVKYSHSDYEDYNPQTCRNGGGYGYDYYTVTKINEVGKVQDL